MIDKKPNLDALRGAYVSLKGLANEQRREADAHRSAAIQCDLRAKDYEDMAKAASESYIVQGGDPALANNWYSWTYLGTAEKSRVSSQRQQEKA